MEKGKTKKASSTKNKISSKKGAINTKKTVSKKTNENKNRVILVIVAIIILIIILISLFGCQKKNNVDKLQGKVIKEDKEDKVADKLDEEIEEKNESTYVFNNTSKTNDVVIINYDDSLKSGIDLTANKRKAAIDAVNKAEETLDKDDINFAKDLVDGLDNDDDIKDELEDRLKDIIDCYNVIKLVERLEKLTYGSKNKSDVLIAINFRADNDIINAVNSLKLEKVKKDLSQRLKKLEPILDDDINPIIINVEEGVYYNIDVLPDIIEENVRSIKINDNDYVIGQDLEDGTYTMIVVDMAFNYDSVSFVIDRHAPELSLVGSDNMTIEYKYGTYEEKGALYKDNIDGKKEILEPTMITKDGVIVNSVDTNSVGTYELTYEAMDKALNESSITRTVIVKDTIYPNAVAIANYKDGKYKVVLSNISEEIKKDDSWIIDNENLVKTFDVFPETIEIEDINGNKSTILVNAEKNAPVINVIETVKGDYKIDYRFDIVDESDISVVKIAEGGFTKEYFNENGTVLSNYEYSIYKNSSYTVYAKDALGNESIKTFTVDFIKAPSIELIGDDNIIVEYKTGIYVENGAIYHNNIDVNGILSNPSKITKNNSEVTSVDINEVGIYNLEYSITDLIGNTIAVTRIVEVKDTIYPNAIAIANYKDGKYKVVLSNISEEIKEDDSWIIDNENLVKTFDALPETIEIEDINGNKSTILVNTEKNAPVINVIETIKSDYKIDYRFDIVDESDISVVKIAEGGFTKEYFNENGTVLSNYEYSVYKNSSYTVYAKDVLGNESVKIFTVDSIKNLSISEEELNNALIVGERQSKLDGYVVYTKNVSINPQNDFDVTEIKYISTSIKYDDITAASFNNNKIHGSNVVVMDEIKSFDAVYHAGKANERHWYIYYKVEKSVGPNKVVRENVIYITPESR